MTDILLTTLNARFTHSSLGLRYLFANLKNLQKQAGILEFTINEKLEDIAEKLLDQSPKIIGIGVYIWNAAEVEALIHYLKKVHPELIIVLGGPEASYTPYRVDFSQADYIIQGEGESQFYQLCQSIMAGIRPQTRIMKPVMEDLKTLELPYAYYSDEDIAHRYIYVEASRGCPFLCEFCLSSIDEKVRNFEIGRLLDAFEILWQRGARNFKFIDRTFNINVGFASKILDFFLAKSEPLFAHFEVIPDHFPEKIKAKIAEFSAGSIQLEIGIQTLKADISDNISRPLRLNKIKENLTFLETETQAHMHVDLIVGLPGEDLKSFGENLNLLYSMTKCEIQIGILKKLSGTVMDRHDQTYKMVYSDRPPYDILKSDRVSFKALQQMKRFARFWDLCYNSGNFQTTMSLLFAEDVYQHFFAFSEWLYGQTQATWKISLDRLATLIYRYLLEERGFDQSLLRETMTADFERVGGHKVPPFLRMSKASNASKPQPHSQSALKRQQKRI